MGLSRMAVYLVGLVVVVAAVWVLLTQTQLGDVVPSGVALAIILLLVGIGVMASARSLNDTRHVSRVVHDGPGVVAPPPARVVEDRTYSAYDTGVAPATRETVVEERRYD